MKTLKLSGKMRTLDIGQHYFTPSEIMLLRHRLEVNDCIAEVLADDDSDEIASVAVKTPNVIHFIALQFMGLMEMGKSVEDIVAHAKADPVWDAVLRDAVEGNTWVCAIPADMPEEAPRRRAVVRAGRSVVAKLRAAGFKTGDVPE